MTTDLWMLLAAVGIQWVLLMSVATVKIVTNGPAWASGARDADSEKVPVWCERLERADTNLKENLPLFAIAVLVVHVSGSADPTSALGSMIFVAARALHPLLYAAGIAGIRTAVWVVSIVGLAMVVSAVF